MISNIKGFINLVDLFGEDGRAVCVKKVSDAAISRLRYIPGQSVLLSVDREGAMTVISHSLDDELTMMAQVELTPNNCIRDLSFSPENSHLLSAHDDKTLQLTDLINLSNVRQFLGHGNDVLTVDYHPSHSLAVSGGKDRMLKFWDPSSQNELNSLYLHTNTINRVKFSTSGSLLASSGKDQVIKILERIKF